MSDAPASTNRIADDPRIDPRLAPLDAIDFAAGVAGTSPYYTAFMDSCDTEEVAPSHGLTVTEHTVVSEPDGNTINIRFVRPAGDAVLPCVYYIHGGGMMAMSCYDSNYRGWARIIAAQGVAVAMVDFRNAAYPSSVPEVAPFPAGLHDCVSGLEWIRAHHRELAIDPDHLIVAGESGGGNLALATGLLLKRDGKLDLIAGLYAICPYIAGTWPSPEHQSWVDNNGIMADLDNNLAAVAYGPEALERRDPLAWPSFATEDDVRGLVPVMISVNECDPLRDEGVDFYRLLLRAGVDALSSGDGRGAHRRDLPGAVPRPQPRHRPEHRRLRPHRGLLT